jgi:pSer/pThr/pTyr-binding forkhead associated (FHA) protein
MPLRLQIEPRAAPRGGSLPGGGHELAFDREITLGRGSPADVRLPKPAVSLIHARITRSADDWFLSDAGSTNGTRLNGAALAPGQRRLLRAGDHIEIPGFVLGVSFGATAEETSAEATAEIARRMVREVLLALGGGDDGTPRLSVLSGPQAGAVLVLEEVGRAYLLGRAESCDLCLADRDASREHASVRREFAGVTIVDLGAKNGVSVRGERIRGGHLLADGDEIVVGGTRLRFDDPAEAYLRKLEALPDAPPGARPDASPDAAPPAPSPPAHAAPPDSESPAPSPRARARGPLAVALFAVAVALAAGAALLALLRS